MTARVERAARTEGREDAAAETAHAETAHAETAHAETEDAAIAHKDLEAGRRVLRLESGSQVKLSGFGNFDLRQKNQRPGRNPKTGEEIPISARRVVTFRPGQKLKSRVEAYAGSVQQ